MKSVTIGKCLSAVVVVAAACVAGCDSGDELPNGKELSGEQAATSQVKSYPISDLMDSVSYRGLSFSPDGNTLIASSDASGIFNVTALPVAGGEPAPLTASTTESNFVVSYFPNDERILFRSDRGGDERFHLYVRELDGTVAKLTEDHGAVTEFHGWSDDGKSFYLRENSRNERHLDLYEVSVETYQRQLIYQNDGLYVLGPVSPDRRYLALNKWTDNRSHHIELLDFKTGRTRPLTPVGLNVHSTAYAFAPDGDHLYYTTDKWHEFQYLARYELATGKHEEVLKYDWDIRGRSTTNPYEIPAVKFSRDGKRLIVIVNENARRVLHVFDTETMARVAGSETPEGSVGSYVLSNDGTKLAMIASSGQMPGDVFLLDLNTGESHSVAGSLSGSIDPRDLVLGEVVRFTSFDGLSIPGVLFKPHHAGVNNRLPALVYVHGGPGGETQVNYEPWIQYIVNRGYVVYGVNNRGSNGSGKTFWHLDDQDHGNRDLKDVVAAKEFLAGQDYVDSDRIGVLGASYGGYMVLAAMIDYPDVFDVGVDIFGVTNWSRTFKARPPWWDAHWVLMHTLMGDLDDEAYWRKKSPLYSAHKIRKPLMVLQGANDPRVVKEESDEIVEAVRANGVPVEYVLFDDEGHGFNKKKNAVVAYESIVDFLDRHLRQKGKE